MEGVSSFSALRGAARCRIFAGRCPKPRPLWLLRGSAPSPARFLKKAGQKLHPKGKANIPAILSGQGDFPRACTTLRFLGRLGMTRTEGCETLGERSAPVFFVILSKPLCGASKDLVFEKTRTDSVGLWVLFVGEAIRLPPPSAGDEGKSNLFAQN